MLCPHCNRYPGVKKFKGYCSQVHYKLARRKPHKVRIPCKGGCGNIIIRNPSAVAPSGNAFCKNCGKNKGELHGKWQEGQYVNKDGYRMVLKNDAYVREHRWVWETVNKACLLRGGTIHHIDFDKLNNSPNNLLLFSNTEHGRFHRFVDAGRYDDAAEILRRAALSQLHYPVGVDAFIIRMFETAPNYRKDSLYSTEV